jgi:L-amino acid N-acyltransferase YncA
MEFIIRQARIDDGAACSRIYAPYVTGTPITFEEQPLDAAAMSERIKETLAMYPFLAAEAGGVVVGYAYAASHRARASYRWSVDVAVYLAAAHHRRGIGRALYGSLLPLLKAQGFVQAYAGITLPNAASVGLHESFGFKQIGIYRHVGYKLGAWRDVGWWELALRDPPVNPGEPTRYLPS